MTVTDLLGTCPGVSRKLTSRSAKIPRLVSYIKIKELFGHVKKSDGYGAERGSSVKHNARVKIMRRNGGQIQVLR